MRKRSEMSMRGREGHGASKYWEYSVSLIWLKCIDLALP